MQNPAAASGSGTKSVDTGLIGGVIICDCRKSLVEPGEVDTVVRGVRLGGLELKEKFRITEGATEPSFFTSSDELRSKFLKRFHDDLRVVGGLGVGISDPRTESQFCAFDASSPLRSFVSLASLAVVDVLAIVASGSGQFTLADFCWRKYNSLRMVTAWSRAPMAESMQASKSVTLSSLLASVR